MLAYGTGGHAAHNTVAHDAVLPAYMSEGGMNSFLNETLDKNRISPVLLEFKNQNNYNVREAVRNLDSSANKGNWQYPTV